MTARSYLYRRNGIYYFRWPIPLACRQRMPPGSPVELRASLRTSHPGTARHLAARHWLAALDVAQRILVSHSSIRYNDLLNAIRGHVGMDGDAAPAQTAGDKLVTLGEVAGTVEVQPLKDALAALDRAGATFYLAVTNQPVEVWGHSHDDDGTSRPEIIEALNDFTDDHARLTRTGIRTALAADRNLIDVKEVHSSQPGLHRSRHDRHGFYDVVLNTPVTCNLSELKVALSYAQQVHTTKPTSPSTPVTATDCDPIRLSEAKDIWVKENRIENGGTWTKATVSNYESYVRQFILLVGDKLTTDLQAKDFTNYESMMRSLPNNWFSQYRRTGMSPQQIALNNRQPEGLAPKSLKDKGSTISLFFAYLKQRGFWHGRYGDALFSSVRASKSNQSERHTFTDEELRLMFSGLGIETFRKAKFPLYVWGSVLLLYTGARSSEISQLLREDVTQDDNGTWYLRMMKSKNGGRQKQFKTKSSIRSVPIHPDVIALGFLKFIERFKAEEPIFPEAFRHNQKSSRELGDWFNEKLLKDTGLKRESDAKEDADLEQDRAVLHSLRHTAINRFKANAQLDHLACAYIGHSTADDKVSSNKIYRDQYGRSFPPTLLAEKLHPLLNFGIDWAPLKAVIDEKGWASTTLAQHSRTAGSEVPRKATPRKTKLVRASH